MSKHTNKYYQLIKVLRHEKQHADMQKALREHRIRLRFDRANTQIDQKVIAEIMDQDNSIEMERKDEQSAQVEEKLVTVQVEAERLWLLFGKKRSKRNTDLPMQQKLSKMKDEARIEQILSSQQQTKSQNAGRINELTLRLKTECAQLDTLKQALAAHRLELDSCDTQLNKLKSDYDRQQKVINERSNKFKQQKSKDIMIKNINREDDQMRNAMMSRIKLNQELDLGFTLQRRRAFNQGKQTIAEKKKQAADSYSKVRAMYEGKVKERQALILEKHDLEERNKQIDLEIAYFLKQLIKHFEDHSRGIKWMVDKLLQVNQSVTADLFPQNIYTQDKQFLQMLFRDTSKVTPKSKKNQQRSSLFSSAPNSTPKHRLNMFHNFKTEPDFNQQSGIVMNRTDSQYVCEGKPKRNKTTVHYDIDNGAQQEKNQDNRWTTSRKFNITSPSLKKVCENTAEVISGLIRGKEWKYQSCKIITSKNKEQLEEGKLTGRMQIESKLKQKFMQVRQHVRRNHLKKFIFGEQQ